MVKLAVGGEIARSVSPVTGGAVPPLPPGAPVPPLPAPPVMLAGRNAQPSPAQIAATNNGRETRIHPKRSLASSVFISFFRSRARDVRRLGGVVKSCTRKHPPHRFPLEGIVIHSAANLVTFFERPADLYARRPGRIGGELPPTPTCRGLASSLRRPVIGARFRRWASGRPGTLRRTSRSRRARARRQSTGSRRSPSVASRRSRESDSPLRRRAACWGPSSGRARSPVDRADRADRASLARRESAVSAP